MWGRRAYIDGEKHIINSIEYYDAVTDGAGYSVGDNLQLLDRRYWINVTVTPATVSEEGAAHDPIDVYTTMRSSPKAEHLHHVGRMMV